MRINLPTMCVFGYRYRSTIRTTGTFHNYGLWKKDEFPQGVIYRVWLLWFMVRVMRDAVASSDEQDRRTRRAVWLFKNG